MHRRPLLWISSGVLLLAVVVWQLTYPTDTVLPLARLDRNFVSGKKSAEIQSMLNEQYTNAPLTLSITGKKYDTTAAKAGMIPDNTAITQGLTAYSTWQRFIPFSLLVIGLMKNQPVSVKLDDSTFTTYATARSQDCAISPTMAGLELDGKKLKLVPAENGQACSTQSIRDAFDGLQLHSTGTSIKVEPQVVNPAGQGVDTSDVIEQARTVVDRTIRLKLLDKTTTISHATLASWLELPYDEATGKFGVQVDSTRVQTYLETAQKPVYIAPGTTHIHTTNGIETSRETGTTGRGVDINTTAVALSAKLLSGDGTVQATMIVLPPYVTYDEPYSADTAGLQKLLNDLVRNKGDYAISLQTVEGGIVASTKGTEHYHPASTYKMFVAWAILKRIDSGKLHWTDSTVNGMSVSKCFDAMIINSDNACGEYFGGDVIGWANLDTALKGIGFGCTDLSPPGWYTCSDDATLFLYKIQSGQLLDADQTNRLLDVMKKQVYRDGIPAGVAVAVADKVGFLYGMLHDAAIVYDSHGTYALTIFTDGSSWGDIADTAWQINAQLNHMK
jgi:beta-lactamase class A